MIGSLRGVLLDRFAKGELLVEVGGVGYRVVVPTGTLGAVGELGAPVFLHVHTAVREDAIVLYGFATAEERTCFEALVGAHGVGPALALAILSVHSPSALRRVVLNDDVDALTEVPGVGKKTAARLLLELKSRLELPDVVDLYGRAGFDVLRTDFLFFFPRALSALRPLESRLARFPAGAQYMVLCRKGKW